MDKTYDFFNTWMTTQKVFDALRAQAEQMQSFYQGQKQQKNPFEAWYNMATDAISSGSDANVVKDTLSKFFGSSSAYQNLFELWQPVLKGMQNKHLDPESWKEMMDPSKIKSMVDKLFNFDMAGTEHLQSQMAQFSELLSSNAGQFGKPWVDAGMRNMQMFPKFAQGSPEALMEMYQNLLKAFDSTVGQSLHIPAVGKDREKMELLSRWINDTSTYASKYLEYQQLMYRTGVEATEKIMAELARKIENGEDISKFDDFFALWVDINEKTFHQLFETSDFAKINGDVLAASLDARKNYFKMMETAMADLPIALRSEMDDLYKTIYELRKEVNKMKSQMKEGNS